MPFCLKSAVILRSFRLIGSLQQLSFYVHNLSTKSQKLQITLLFFLAKQHIFRANKSPKPLKLYTNLISETGDIKKRSECRVQFLSAQCSMGRMKYLLCSVQCSVHCTFYIKECGASSHAVKY